MFLSLAVLSVGSYRPGHPWGASRIAATYLNKTACRAAIRLPSLPEYLLPRPSANKQIKLRRSDVAQRGGDLAFKKLPPASIFALPAVAIFAPEIATIGRGEGGGVAFVLKWFSCLASNFLLLLLVPR